MPFFLRSVEINEQSINAGGLPQWPAKSLILIGFTLLLFQGISELIKRIAVMRGDHSGSARIDRRMPIEAEVERSRRGDRKALIDGHGSPGD